MAILIYKPSRRTNFHPNYAVTRDLRLRVEYGAKGEESTLFITHFLPRFFHASLGFLVSRKLHSPDTPPSSFSSIPSFSDKFLLALSLPGTFPLRFRANSALFLSFLSRVSPSQSNTTHGSSSLEQRFTANSPPTRLRRNFARLRGRSSSVPTLASPTTGLPSLHLPSPTTSKGLLAPPFGRHLPSPTHPGSELQASQITLSTPNSRTRLQSPSSSLPNSRLHTLSLGSLSFTYTNTLTYTRPRTSEFPNTITDSPARLLSLPASLSSSALSFSFLPSLSLSPLLPFFSRCKWGWGKATLSFFLSPPISFQFHLKINPRPSD